MTRRVFKLLFVAAGTLAGSAACQYDGGDPAADAGSPSSAAGRGTASPADESAAPKHERAEIIPVNSRAHYLENLRSRGLSEAEVDERYARYMESLRTLDRSEGEDRIGFAAPAFQFDTWINSEPLSVEDLRGQVAVVRWWIDTCVYCASSAPALRALHEDYSGSGLTVIGVFHPKAGRDDPLDVARVERAVETRQFEFPVAIDWDWRTKTLKEWWETGPDRSATSVTFILDKSGIIRFVHPGMEYHDHEGDEEHAMCVDDMAKICSVIERLIVE